MKPDMGASFGQWVKRRRKSLDLTQGALAERVGCSTATIEKIEADQRRPSRQVAGILAAVLEIPPEELDTFIKVARRERSLERLEGISPLAAQPRRINLPAPPTALVGRQAELAELERLLKNPDCRLLTLIGAGGIGKTRLAIQAAGNLQDFFADGVYFVGLVGVDQVEFVAPMAAEALDLAFSGPASPQSQLVGHLKDARLLLVLDNYEQLLPEVGIICEILQKACGVKLLVTSREPLGIPGEWLFDVQGLPVPHVAGGQVEANSAVALFLQSARRSRLNFELQAEDLPSVIAICEIVAGMPLGIELAAAWVRTLSCLEIINEIQKNIGFLEVSLPGVPERHRSLQAVFDHSWKLLNPDEQEVLQRLSVFRGGFTRSAAEEIADASLALLANLALKSLVYRAESGRYDLHEVVRQFAAARLSASQHFETTNSAHCDFYLSMLCDQEPELKSANQPEAIHRLTGEIENIREAWTWAIQHRKLRLLQASLRSLGYLCNIIGWLQDGIDQVQLVVDGLDTGSLDEAERAVLGLAHEQQGLLSFRQGNFGQAIYHCQKGIEISRPLNDPDLLSGCCVLSGVIMHLLGEIEKSTELSIEGLASARAAGDDWFAAYAIYNLGYVACLKGDYAAGYTQMVEGLNMWRRIGDPSCIALGLNYISPTAILLGRIDEAKQFLQESLKLTSGVGDWWGTGTAYRNLGLAALAMGDLAEARGLLNKSLEIFQKVVIGWDIVRSLDYLARVEMAAGDFSEARRIYMQALVMAMEVHTYPLAVDILTGLASLHAQAGEFELAARLALFVISDPLAVFETRQAAVKLVAEAEIHLPRSAVRKIHEQSSGLSLESLAAELLAGQ